MKAWSDRLDADAIVEFPYAAALGSPSSLEGKLAIYDYMKHAVAQWQNWVFTDVRAYQTLLLKVLFAEFHGEAVFVATGQPYQQDYVVRLEIRNGKIMHYRKYWNPVPLLERVGSRETSCPALEIKSLSNTLDKI